ncbi:hypothetical protein [Kineosporia mesophila]|uniref:hypothetical protein n=1 Tax=Kineosporia mesophila TaxID=566012 RepID=UPI001E55ACBC|nr:hypothetical protein [Kineosporia mesophila]MCD5349131.1 hypothetical protein [Kineosporia mesophila]
MVKRLPSHFTGAVEASMLVVVRPRRHVAPVLAALGTAVLLTACSGGGSDSNPAPTGSDGSSTGSTDGADSADSAEAAKGQACEEYRDLTTQVDAANAQAQDLTVSTEEDGKKVTELLTKVSDLTEKADAAYALCYAEGSEPQ